MPTLADTGDLTAEGWVLIIGAIFFGIQQVLKMILDYRYNKDQQKRDEKVAEKLNETTVKQDEIKNKVVETAIKQDVIKEKVEEVRKATTNGSSTQIPRMP